jgi:hypothetical protein
MRRILIGTTDVSGHRTESKEFPMRLVNAVSAAVVLVLMSPILLLAQSVQPGPTVSIPRLISVSGVFQPIDGQPPAPAETVTFSVFAEPEGGAPLWQETQVVSCDKTGRFTVLLGATQADGIPPEVFASGEAQWMSMGVNRVGEVAQPRVRITSVPYALRASDAATLGGLPASAYVLAPTASERDRAANGGSVKEPSLAPAERAVRAPDLVQPGTTNFLAKYVNSDDVGNSAVYEAGGSVGIGTTTPLDALHLRINNTLGTQTGLAVQNLGNTPTSYSGMLFYDQFGALGQFQGFNNFTHEYRINNVAQNGSQYNGSINFMTGNTSRFIVASNGNIGIGTTTPSALLEVSNAVPGGPANMWMTSYTNFINPYYMARRARGTPGAPTAVQSGDGLAGFYGEGYGTTAFGPGFAGGMTVQAAQNWTDTAHGTALTFTTTPISSTASATRMTIDATGFLGIGTTTTPAAGVLEVSNAGNPAPFGSITGSSFTGSNPAGTLFIGRKARGTSAAPTAVQNGDNLVGFLGEGYGATAFSLTRGGMFVRAAENWTDTAQGTALNFNTTAFGTNTPGTKMTVDPAGNVGVGTTAPSEAVEAVRGGAQGAAFLATSFGAEETNGGSAFVTRNARGTAAAPAAVHRGDALGFFAGNGYGTSGFGDEFGGGMAIVAAEDWTDAAQGALVAFITKPLGANEGAAHMAIMPDGNVGIGTFDDIPTIADKLQVFGDIRIGTTGTNGCIKDFSGTGILGTCASDRRFKRDITPFGPVLGSLTALQPVHYFWRAADFPNQHFGESRAYGLIAQDVEQILPELVETGADGFKAVNYSKLPLLTIQAVKELKAENDALKQRVTELERVFAEMMAAAARR